MKIMIVGAGAGGPGAVGRGLQDLIKQTYPDWKTDFFGSQSNRERFSLILESYDAVALCISTKDNGLIEAKYVLDAVQKTRPIPIAICGKGALSEYFGVLKPYLPYIGYSATVGGGSGILDLLAQPKYGEIGTIMGVVNGTLNFIADCIAQGKNSAEAVKLAQGKGLCEPGNLTFTEIVNAELLDARRKASILFNLAMRECVPANGVTLKVSEFESMVWGDHSANRMFTDGKRLVVTIFPDHDRTRYMKVFGAPDFVCFSKRVNGYYVAGTFMKAEELLRYIPKEEENCLFVNDDFKYGIGAGVVPTAAAMLVDLKKLLKVN